MTPAFFFVGGQGGQENPAGRRLSITPAIQVLSAADDNPSAHDVRLLCGLSCPISRTSRIERYASSYAVVAGHRALQSYPADAWLLALSPLCLSPCTNRCDRLTLEITLPWHRPPWTARSRRRRSSR
jgi:hypothetical protein